MTKQKKHHARHKGGIMGRSDIPFAQRMRMQQGHNIVVNRGQAAKVVLYAVSMALHELEGVGYTRLVRYSFHYKELEDEFYEDQEVGMAHAARRMKDMGMPISGEFYQAPDRGLSRREREVDNHVMQACQVALIISAIAMNDVFGLGYERQTRIRERVGQLIARYQDEGIGFLLEGMAAMGFKIVDGVAMLYLDEDGNAYKPKKGELVDGN